RRSTQRGNQQSRGYAENSRRQARTKHRRPQGRRGRSGRHIQGFVERPIGGARNQVHRSAIACRFPLRSTGSVMENPSLRTREREVESARTKLTEDLAVLCSPGILADFGHSLKQEALESGDRLWEKLKAQAAANPAAVMAIAAGLGWRLMRRPPIASSLIGLGLFSLLRTTAEPLDPRTSFLQQSARSLQGQASAIGETAARAKDTIAEKSAETWDSTKDK